MNKWWKQSECYILVQHNGLRGERTVSRIWTASQFVTLFDELWIKYSRIQLPKIELAGDYEYANENTCYSPRFWYKLTKIMRIVVFQKYHIWGQKFHTFDYPMHQKSKSMDFSTKIVNQPVVNMKCFNLKYYLNFFKFKHLLCGVTIDIPTPGPDCW